MAERTLNTLDNLLMAGGAVILLLAVAWWWWTGRRDPLRGAPLRVNRLEVAHIWFCIAVVLLSWAAGGQIAAWIAPDGLSQEQLRNWQGVFDANFGAAVNIVVCLSLAWVTFRGGLRGFGFGRQRLTSVIKWGVGGWLVGLFLTGGIFWITHWVLRSFFPQYQPPEHGVFTALRDPSLRPWMRAVASFGAFALVPVGEEVLFRGILQTGFQKLIPPRAGSLQHRWAAILAIGMLFGAVHSSTPQHIPALMVLGMLLGFLYERTGSLRVPILVHMLFNGKSLLWDFLARTYMQSQ